MPSKKEPPATTGLHRIAVKAHKEPELRFTSLAHHITKYRIWQNLCLIGGKSTGSSDSMAVMRAKERFNDWIEPVLQSMHSKRYPVPPISGEYAPYPAKRQNRHLDTLRIIDRALQLSTAEVLSAIYEQEFLSFSYGGRPGSSVHDALATLKDVIAASKVGWVLEARVQRFCTSLDPQWMMKFVHRRIGDPRLISLIRRWLKAGVFEEGAIHLNAAGTSEDDSMTVLLSNVYLHYVLGLWFERDIKQHLKGEAYIVRYLDEFVLCFKYRSDARRVQQALHKQLKKYSLSLDPTKTKLVKLGHFNRSYTPKRGAYSRQRSIFLHSVTYSPQIQEGNATADQEA